ncbi:hypothetical protein Tco_1053494 [Tanacetum coccineum]|uniref:Uncharacterized protein n=1 Tax=Tanacetum coccineum TaxID=301880 RepID=A0ABQ5GVY0_9ASTR
MFETKFETPLDSLPITVIDPDDQPMWIINFDGRIWSDPHRHVADFLEISNLFQYGENQEEAIMLRTFPFSLSREGIRSSRYKIDSEFLIIRKDLKEMRDGHRDNYASQIYTSDETSMCDPMEGNYDCTAHIPYTNVKMFADDVLLNHVGDKELKSFDRVGNSLLTKKENDDRAGNGKEDAWRQNRLFSHAYASFCIAFTIWSSIAISHAHEV